MTCIEKLFLSVTGLNSDLLTVIAGLPCCFARFPLELFLYFLHQTRDGLIRLYDAWFRQFALYYTAIFMDGIF